jgi:pimeloyl-ACP methyl ester carboxylesterase
MIEHETYIKNRHGLKLYIKVMLRPGSLKNAYLAHGLSDVHSSNHMQALIAAYLAQGYNVITWDATNSYGRSEGSYDNASFDRHYEDMEDVILWSREQTFYRQPFSLCGHSLGGIAVGTYAAKHPEEVETLVLNAPVVSGELLSRRIHPLIRTYWRLRGHIVEPGKNRKRYKWELIRSGLKYDLIRDSKALNMPILIVGAGKDRFVPVANIRAFVDVLPKNKVTVVIDPIATHSFDTRHETTVLRRVVGGWLERMAPRPEVELTPEEPAGILDTQALPRKFV